MSKLGNPAAMMLLSDKNIQDKLLNTGDKLIDNQIRLSKFVGRVLLIGVGGVVTVVLVRKGIKYLKNRKENIENGEFADNDILQLAMLFRKALDKTFADEDLIMDTASKVTNFSDVQAEYRKQYYNKLSFIDEKISRYIDNEADLLKDIERALNKDEFIEFQKIISIGNTQNKARKEKEELDKERTGKSVKIVNDTWYRSVTKLDELKKNLTSGIFVKKGKLRGAKTTGNVWDVNNDDGLFKPVIRYNPHIEFVMNNKKYWIPKADVEIY